MKAEEAIQAANEARIAAVQKSVELSEKAKDATRTAETQVTKSIRKQEKAHQKVSVFRGENFDLRTKRMTKQWEETLVRKHELWEVYKTLKKNYYITGLNVKAVKNNLKQAENSVLKLMKINALNPADVGILSRIDGAKSR